MKTWMLMGLLCASTTAQALELKGQVTFNKSAPFVGIAYIEGEPLQPQAVTIDQNNKRFDQTSYVVTPGQALVFNNSDNMDHNIFINAPKANASLDLGLLSPEQSVSAKTDGWQKQAVVRLACKIHPKMKAYVANIAAETSQVLNFERKVLAYKFALSSEQVAPKFIFWMPKYDRIELELSPGVQTIAITKRGKVKGELKLELI